MPNTYRINGVTVPPYARPQHTDGVMYPEGDGEINLYGQPVGARGTPSIRFWWDRISVDGFIWWRNWIGAGRLSANLNDVVVPDDQTSESVGSAAHHRNWNVGVLHRIKKLPGARRVIYNGNEEWIEGEVEVLITELGRYF